MPTGQNKVLKLYGPWRGQDDSGTRTDYVEFEKCFNVEFTADEIVTRNGRTVLIQGNQGRCRALHPLPDGTFLAVVDYEPDKSRLVYIASASGIWTQLASPGTAVYGTPATIRAWYKGAILAVGSGLWYYDAADGLKAISAVQGLDTTVSAYLTAIPDTSLVEVYRNRVYIANGKTVVFSEYDNATDIIPADGTAPYGAPHVWPAGNDFDVEGGPNDEIVALKLFGDTLAILTRAGLFIWDEDALRQVPGAPGGLSATGVVVTPVGLLYTAIDGFRLFDGSATRRISEPVERSLGKYLYRARFDEVVAVHFQRKHEARFYVPTYGSKQNRLCLIWDYEENRWYMHGGRPPWAAAWVSGANPIQDMYVAAAVLSTQMDDETLITADYNGSLWIEDYGITDAGKGIYSCIVFKRLKLGEDSGVMLWRDLIIQARANYVAIRVAMLGEGQPVETAYPTRYAVTALPDQASWNIQTVNLPGGITKTAYWQIPPDQYGAIVDVGGNGFVRRMALNNFPLVNPIAPDSLWGSFRVPFAAVARTMQPVLICDGFTGTLRQRCTARMAIRGIELAVRQKASGRRPDTHSGLANANDSPGINIFPPPHS